MVNITSPKKLHTPSLKQPRAKAPESSTTPVLDTFAGSVSSVLMSPRTVVAPLIAAANDLERDIEERKEEREFLLRDDDSVPDKYRKNVSSYFRSLSESEGGR